MVNARHSAHLIRAAGKYGAAIGVVACLGAWHSQAYAQSKDTPVASDGKEIVSRSTGRVVESSFRGQGAALAEGQVDDQLANVPARRESASEFARLLALRPATAPVGIESIIGVDQRTLVNPTTTYPARATVLITFNTPSGGARCTGWLIGKDTVITAGHCVAPGTGSGIFYSRTSYRIYPGRNGASSPYGSCLATRLFSVTGWTSGGDERFDYGAIKLNCNIGTTTGWYGFFWQSASLVGLPVTIRGYPGDKPLTQWRSADIVRANTVDQVFYKADTTGGQSGSPVFYNRSSTCNPCSMAVHAYGLHGVAPHNANNHGTRITQARFNNFITWKNAAK
jgi:glutamyl endopeptidase